MSLSKITTCLWFNDAADAEEAAKTYTSIFPNSQITHTNRYLDAGSECHGHNAGELLTISFTLNGQSFVILNGGVQPNIKHNEAVSFQIECKDQEEVDHYWNSLAKGGAEERQNCGWLADKWGIAWQVVPKQLIEWLGDKDKKKAGRVTNAMMSMKKMDIEGLRKAYEEAES
ncbi:3-demethylubiquinone-9 3-methyltransferase-domain-containing protein [Pyrenochaeta sp. MPI-SDFR-AT-0127]|nr:3-demethylubiquinone-9 3-methyltransferase-domain-containing protein [Pyrenochaeta sp. MPI-SDFR-AT-0127]